MRVNFLAVACLSIPAYPLMAGHTDFITEQDVFGDIPVVSIASNMLQPLNKAPASITVIDRQLIDASGAQNWVDIFRLVPGFQAYAVNGNRYGISYHGFGREFPNHLEIMIDGRSIYSPAFSSINWPALGLSLNDVDHIEVVRGSSAPAHGSNAFLGAINIITRQPIQDSGTTITATTGDRSTREGNISHNGNWKDLDYRASIFYRSDDGFPSVSPSADEDGGPLDDGIEQISTNLYGVYTPNLQDTFNLQAGFSHSNSGWGDVDHPDEYSNAEFDSHFQSLKWNRSLQSGDELQLHIYHNRVSGENYENLGMASELLSEELGFPVTPAMLPGLIGVEDQPVIFGFRDIETRRYDIELEHRLQVSESFRATWGAGYRRESVKAEALFADNETRYLNSRRLFGHGEWLLSSRWTLNAGTMIEDNNLVGTIASSRLALNYHLTPTHTLRMGIARAQRSPSLVEDDEFNADFLDGGDNDDLLIQAIRRSVGNIDEEHLTSYELGYVGTFPEQSLTFDARLFREELRDGLEVFQGPIPPEHNALNPSDQFSTRDNILTVDMTGIELQLRYQPSNGTLISTVYSYQDVDSDFFSGEQNGVTITRDHNDRAPRHTASLVISQQLTKQLTGSINAYHMNEADWRDGNFVDEFTRIDARLSYHFQAGKSRGRLSLIGQNLGEDYTEHGQNNIFETRVYLKLELQLP